MRKSILNAVLAALALPAGARVTVVQLEQVLIKARAAHKQDTDIARQIRSVELSERLTEARLGRLSTNLAPGPQTVHALNLIADQSAFLDPPTSEIPSLPRPDDATQQRMLDAARSYVAQTLAALPNFLATRTTNRFDDSPQAPTKNAWPVRAGLHFVDRSSTEISVRDDQDTLTSTPRAKASPVQPPSGLTSWGEFGPMLTLILADSAGGTVSWDHWEESAVAPVAVFHYSVPRARSHYVVSGSLPQHPFVESSSTVPGGFGLKPGLDVSKQAVFRITPGYHGSLWLDPTTGTVLRISIEADLKDRDPVKRADALVQYGPIMIAGRRYICPVRSLALRLDPIDPNDTSGAAPILELNETLFTDYHRFISTIRILDDAPHAK